MLKKIKIRGGGSVPTPITDSDELPMETNIIQFSLASIRFSSDHNKKLRMKQYIECDRLYSFLPFFSSIS